ncbi:MAG: GNAT family N-acetyltransferase [Solirubrobacteraceae bacterium]
MDDGMLRERLWQGFARLQTLLGGQAAGGAIVEDHGVVASFVPAAPDSPTLNAAIALAAGLDPAVLDALGRRYDDIGIRRWGVWTDGTRRAVVRTLHSAAMRLTASSPGMGAEIADLRLNGRGPAGPADLATVGRVNDLAYGNPDSRLERTLAPLPTGLLHAYRADVDGRPASVALALYHGEDCGVSFVATAPHARRQGLATGVMHRVALDAGAAGCTTTTLQATALGEKLYKALGYRKVSEMQLWEPRRER